MRDYASLQRLGRVLHVSSSRNLILKAENTPRIGDRVVNKDLKPVGTVFDVFGPVASPYVAVKPEVEEPSNIMGDTLYSVLSPQTKRKKRR